MVNWLRIAVSVCRYVVENAWVELCWVGIALLYTPSLSDVFGIEKRTVVMPSGLLPCILSDQFGGGDIR